MATKRSGSIVDLALIAIAAFLVYKFRDRLGLKEWFDRVLGTTQADVGDEKKGDKQDPELTKHTDESIDQKMPARDIPIPDRSTIPTKNLSEYDQWVGEHIGERKIVPITVADNRIRVKEVVRTPLVVFNSKMKAIEIPWTLVPEALAYRHSQPLPAMQWMSIYLIKMQEDILGVSGYPNSWKNSKYMGPGMAAYRPWLVGENAKLWTSSIQDPDLRSIFEALVNRYNHFWLQTFGKTFTESVPKVE